MDIPLADMLVIERTGDKDALRAAIIEALRAGDMSPGTQRWLADMFDLNSNAAYKLEKFTRNIEGSQKQRKQRKATLDQLVELYRKTKNPTTFVRLAAKLTGYDPNTIRRKYRAAVEQRIAAEDAEESELHEWEQQQRLKEFKEICASAPDEQAAAEKANKVLGVPKEQTLAILARAKAKRLPGEDRPQLD